MRRKTHQQIVREIERGHQSERAAWAIERAGLAQERADLLAHIMVLSGRPPLTQVGPEEEPRDEEPRDHIIEGAETLDYSQELTYVE